MTAVCENQFLANAMRCAKKFEPGRIVQGSSVQIADSEFVKETAEKTEAIGSKNLKAMQELLHRSLPVPSSTLPVILVSQKWSTAPLLDRLSSL